MTSLILRGYLPGFPPQMVEPVAAALRQAFEERELPTLVVPLSSVGR